MDRSASLYERVIGRPQPLWVKVVVSICLLSLPFLVTILSGLSEALISKGIWRYLLLTPSIVIYIWLGSPILDRQAKEVNRSLRSISELDDESYDRLIAQAQYIKPRNEWIAIGVGAVAGLAINSANDFSQLSILFQAYWALSMMVMYALMAWIIYLSIASSRSGSRILHQPLQINLFNPAPFEAIGRQGLLLALMFIGGITISLLFSFRWENLAEPLFWVIYLTLVLVTLLIFFTSMRPAHRLLARQKEKELSGVHNSLERLGRELTQRLDDGQDAAQVASQFNAISAYEARLQSTRTWPYNTSMLRTLFFSFLVPLGSFLVKTAIDLILP